MQSIVDIGFTTAVTTGAYWVVGHPLLGKIGTFEIGPEQFWTDVTEDVISYRIDRGSTRGEGPVLRYTEGTAEIVLYNPDGRYDPLNLWAAPLNPNPYFAANVSGWSAVGCTLTRSTAFAHEGAASMLVTPDGVTATVQATTTRVAVTAGTSYRAHGWLLSPAGYSAVGVAVHWWDALVGGSLLSTSIDAVSIPAGTWLERANMFTAPVGAVAADVFVRIANTPAAGDILYADQIELALPAPHVVDGVSEIDAMRLTRIRATHDNESYQLFLGYADSWVPDYPAPNHGFTTLTATDGQKVIHRQTRTVTAPVGAGELPGARINRILDAIFWPTADRVIDPGLTTLQATTHEGDAWDEMVLVQDTEGGHLYMDTSGNVVFRDRHAILEDERSATTNATFGQAGGSELMYVAITPSADDDALANRVEITREGGTMQVKQDLASQARYLVSTYERTDLLMTTDGEALQYAGWVLFQGKDAEARFDQITLDPRINEDGLWPQLLGREIGDRITITSRQLGYPIIQDVFIRGIHHARTPGRGWSTTWELSAASKYSFWKIGHATLGRIGHVAIAF